MQRFSNTIIKNKDAKVLKYHYKNTFTKDKTNRYIYFIKYIQVFLQKPNMKGSHKTIQYKGSQQHYKNLS
jgi:hypothetical protein